MARLGKIRCGRAKYEAYLYRGTGRGQQNDLFPQHESVPNDGQGRLSSS